MSPVSGFSVPAIWWISVDFPAPFGPISAWISPGRRSSVTPSVAFSAPKDLRKSLMSRMASTMALPPSQKSDKATACEENDAKEHEPKEELPALGEPAEQELEHHEQHRTGNGSGKTPDTAKDDQHDEFAG